MRVGLVDEGRNRVATVTNHAGGLAQDDVEDLTITDAQTVICARMEAFNHQRGAEANGMGVRRFDVLRTAQPCNHASATIPVCRLYHHRKAKRLGSANGLCSGSHNMMGRNRQTSLGQNGRTQGLATGQ